MRLPIIIILSVFLNLFSNSVYAQIIRPGAEQVEQYLPLLKNKKVGIFANHSSLIGHTHLVDVLKQRGVHITKIFAPEHGFRGVADDGDVINNTRDKKTGIPIISLYGKKLKPNAADLHDVDILIFDVQDVGVRFYTYISSLQYLMEAAIQHHKPLIILDRPNPNGFYVDGPVSYKKSFTGMQPVPTVYGMTMGEYAKMLVGEEWLTVSPKSKAKTLKLTVVPCQNYTHKSYYIPPVRPSPNLPDIQSIYLYPSIGLIESTSLSVGRGTSNPFQVFGHPSLPNTFTFIPRSQEGARNPKYKNKICHGWNLKDSKENILRKINNKLQLHYMIKAYQAFPNKKRFFEEPYGSKSNTLAAQIRRGMSEADIRKSWEPELKKFKRIRKKYLLYEDV